jgi:hypothetical protein
MEVHFTPDVQAKLDQMARDTGLPSATGAPKSLSSASPNSSRRPPLPTAKP